jgi:Na+-transporting NADH:ubiquinone oxidoreductase subunit NqrC
LWCFCSVSLSVLSSVFVVWVSCILSCLCCGAVVHLTPTTASQHKQDKINQTDSTKTIDKADKETEFYTHRRTYQNSRHKFTLLRTTAPQHNKDKIHETHTTKTLDRTDKETEQKHHKNYKQDRDRSGITLITTHTPLHTPIVILSYFILINNMSSSTHLSS